VLHNVIYVGNYPTIRGVNIGDFSNVPIQYIPFHCITIIQNSRKNV